MSDEHNRYAKAWKEMRYKGIIAGFFSVLGVAYIFLWIAGAITFDRHRFLQPYILPVIIPLVLINVYAFSRCPRCKKSFFVKPLKSLAQSHLFTTNCINCGLSRGALGD